MHLLYRLKKLTAFLELELSSKKKNTDKDDLGLKDFMPDVSHGYIATAGIKLSNTYQKPNKLEIIKALMEVKDPEIPVNIYDLGLIYNIDINHEGDVDITMSLTAPGCPVAGEMPNQVAQKVASLEKVGIVNVTLVWDPPWTPDRMSKDAKLALDYSF